MVVDKVVKRACLVFLACTGVALFLYGRTHIQRSSEQLSTTWSKEGRALPFRAQGNSKTNVTTAVDQRLSLNYRTPSALKYLNRTYVITHKYQGQQGAGVRGIASFQCFLKSLGGSFALAEPHIERNRLLGHSTGGKDGFKFSDLFDIDLFNRKSSDGSRAEMISIKEFLQHCPRNTILINTVLGDRKQILWTAASVGGKKRRCLNDEIINELNGKDLQDKLEKSMERVKHDACVVRVLELSVLMTFSERAQRSADLKDWIFQGWSPSDVTLDFNTWGGPFNVPEHGGAHCFREYNTSITNILFKPSKRLLRDAKQYEDVFLEGQNKLAVMIRAEKIIEFYLTQEKLSSELDSLEECFDEVMRLSRAIYNATGSTKPLVTMDIGRFGSASLVALENTKREHMVEASKKTLMALYRNQWTFEEWENSFIEATGGVTNNCYIAALQRTLAARADCLVLMGGGSFQTLAVEGYLDYHNNSAKDTCIHLVCGMTHGSRLVQRLINNHTSTYRPP